MKVRRTCRVICLWRNGSLKPITISRRPAGLTLGIGLRRHDIPALFWRWAITPATESAGELSVARPRCSKSSVCSNGFSSRSGPGEHGYVLFRQDYPGRVLNTRRCLSRFELDACWTKVSAN